MKCKLCKIEIEKNKHGLEKKFCSAKCRDYYHNHKLKDKRGDIFRQIAQRSYEKIYS